MARPCAASKALERLPPSHAPVGRLEDNPDQQPTWLDHRVVAVMQHRNSPYRAAGEAS